LTNRGNFSLFGGNRGQAGRFSKPLFEATIKPPRQKSFFAIFPRFFLKRRTLKSGRLKNLQRREIS
jgi:hypothetical protein